MGRGRGLARKLHMIGDLAPLRRRLGYASSVSLFVNIRLADVERGSKRPFVMSTSRASD